MSSEQLIEQIKNAPTDWLRDAVDLLVAGIRDSDIIDDKEVFVALMDEIKKRMI